MTNARVRRFNGNEGETEKPIKEEPGAGMGEVEPVTEEDGTRDGEVREGGEKAVEAEEEEVEEEESKGENAVTEVEIIQVGEMLVNVVKQRAEYGGPTTLLMVLANRLA